MKIRMLKILLFRKKETNPYQTIMCVRHNQHAEDFFHDSYFLFFVRLSSTACAVLCFAVLCARLG
ncbi:hypothetical protein CANARDRAFT_73541 [[Candida] arabinofermentans NRRL YB-2248]|uniref:Uncharacterized protein n=1 Tax=[Candida] arabinofermentans NRRL YB-2248 TaxID=983967 RepID=A0A1E4SWM1_9ASCO|nr:hypothetical protein CANARDRAFT_73541 [[Candida] arabinofermentans NRRL YB-2248]